MTLGRCDSTGARRQPAREHLAQVGQDLAVGPLVVRPGAPVLDARQVGLKHGDFLGEPIQGQLLGQVDPLVPVEGLLAKRRVIPVKSRERRHKPSRGTARGDLFGRWARDLCPAGNCGCPGTLEVED